MSGPMNTKRAIHVALLFKYDSVPQPTALTLSHLALKYIHVTGAGFFLSSLLIFFSLLGFET